MDSKNKGKTVANSTIKPAIVYEGGKKRGMEHLCIQESYILQPVQIGIGAEMPCDEELPVLML